MNNENITCIDCMRTLPRRRFKLSNIIGENYICEVCCRVPTAFKIDSISRECLKCNKDFSAPNKYIRLCGSCKGKIDQEDYSLWES